MAVYGFVLSDTITVNPGYVCKLDTNDTTGKTVTTTTSADEKAFFTALEKAGSATAGANAGKIVSFDGPESVDVVLAGAVTIADSLASSTTAGKVDNCTAAAGDFSIGYAGATGAANGIIRMYKAPHQVA